MLVALVGQPNSGKSALLGCLTGAKVFTSNYPGTTVEVTEGRVPGTGITVLDTPGIYSMRALSKEQQVTRKVILERRPRVIVNVVDGTSLRKQLPLTLSLKSLGIPIVLAVNQADRMKELGIHIDLDVLRKETGAEAVLTSAITGEGAETLLQAIEKAAASGAGEDGPSAPFSSHEPCRSFEPYDLRDLHEAASAIADRTVRLRGASGRRSPAEYLDRLLDRPAASWLVLGGLLWAVWRFSSWALPFAETSVRMILNPLRVHAESLLRAVLPRGPLAETLSEAVPEGFILPMATVLPAMILAYSLMAVLEDSGFLGRMAALSDVFTAALNLPGQSMIPLTLGFGCRVPALMAARILPGERSRRTASLIIATCVPCTATISLSLAALAKFRASFAVPGVLTAVSALTIGWAARLIPGGQKEPLVLELPPLRIPSLRNIAMKTQARLRGFFSHALPLLVVVNSAVRVFMSQGLPAGANVSRFSRVYLGIPPEALWSVLLTMFQRYLAPLFLMQQNLTPREAVIAVSMVALGFPCLPSAVVLWRENGARFVLLTFLTSLILFIGWGMVLNLILPS